MGVTEAVIFIAVLLLSGMFHEQWHARSALWLGDSTARDLGRLSWNPAVHLDPFLSFILPAVTYALMGFPFGGAKPVPIVPGRMRNPGLGLALSSAAGPLSNFFLAAASFLVFYGLFRAVPGLLFTRDFQPTYNAVFLKTFVMLNLLLGSFNLLPLPGLDGSRIIRFFLPRGLQAVLDSLEPYALMITMLAVGLGAANLVIIPIYVLAQGSFLALFGPDFTRALFPELRFGA